MKASKKKYIKWQIYDKSGARFIMEKFAPPKEKNIKRKPSSLLLWVFGIYFALYGITTTRYENRIDRIENHANIVVAQLGSENYKNALAMIPSVQKRTAPIEPDIWSPLTLWNTWDSTKNTTYVEVVERLKEVVVAWKGLLDSVDLSNAHLENAKLIYAHLENADLWGANLTGIKTSFLIEDETIETRIAFIKELEKAKKVQGIQFDKEIMDIIERDFPALLKRIEKGEGEGE